MESKLSPIDSIIAVDKQKFEFHFYLKKKKHADTKASHQNNSFISFFIAINPSSMLYSLLMNDIFSLETLRFSSIRAYSTIVFGHMTYLWVQGQCDLCYPFLWNIGRLGPTRFFESHPVQFCFVSVIKKRAESALKLRLYRIYMSRYCTPKVMLLKLRWISFVGSELLYMGMMSVLI